MGDAHDGVPFLDGLDFLGEFIKRYHTSFVGVSSQDDHDYIGGGTLLWVNEVPGVLTADHVWHDVLDGRYVQVAIAGAKKAGRIPVGVLRVHRLNAEVDDGFGPDLAFVELPTAYAEDLGQGGKAYYGLASFRAATRTIPPATVGEWRIVFGIPAESTNTFEDEDHEGPLVTMAVDTQKLTAPISKVHTRDGYDYSDLSLDDKQGDNFPQSMKGVSGSGLWRFRDGRAGPFVADTNRIVLDGVVVRHREKAPEFLRCHGRRSIYRFLDSLDIKPR